MGYRLEMSKVEYSACGFKLYGYIDENILKQFKSYQWLLKHNYIDGDEYWDYGFNPQIILRPEDFKEFIKLYNEDYNSVSDEKDVVINDKKIQALIDSEERVLLEWW